MNAATTDESTIRKWWKTLATGHDRRAMDASGVWAVDPDPPKTPEEPDGREIWAGLVQEHGELPATHTEITPRGGYHILFKWDPARPVTNSPGALAGTNVDVRGEGGYLVVAPSVSAEGGRYNVVAPLDFFHFAVAPDWLYELILKKPEPKRRTALPLAIRSSLLTPAGHPFFFAASIVPPWLIYRRGCRRYFPAPNTSQGQRRFASRRACSAATSRRIFRSRPTALSISASTTWATPRRASGRLSTS